MKLKNASKFFDKTVAKDAYNALASFKCQVEPFDYVKIDGAAVKRRVMSTAVGVTIPTRHTIRIDSQNYLVGDSSPDHWAGEAIRNRYVLQGADSVVQIQTIAQVLANTAGTQAFASIDFNKYATDERDNSEFHPQYHIFFGKGEVVPENAILSTATATYLVRNSYTAVSGLVDALSNQLDSPVTDNATSKVRTYNPVTDTYTDASSTVRCLRVRWQDQFAYLSQGSTKYERGDMQVMVALSVTPKASDTITLSDGVWKILSVRDLADHRSLHVRRA